MGVGIPSCRSRSPLLHHDGARGNPDARGRLMPVDTGKRPAPPIQFVSGGEAEPTDLEMDAAHAPAGAAYTSGRGPLLERASRARNS